MEWLAQMMREAPQSRKLWVGVVWYVVGHQYHGALQLPWLHTFKGAFIRVLNVFVLGGVIVSVGRVRSRVTVDVYYIKTVQGVLLQTQARFILNVSN